MVEDTEILKYQLFLDIRPSSGFTSGYGIFQPHFKTLDINPPSDFFINVPLYHNHEVYEYVDTQIDETIEQIPRQEVNPFYLEYEFFDDIVRNKVNNAAELSSIQLNYIRTVRFDVSFLNDQDLRNWFDAQGKNELPWTTVFGEKITIYDIELAQLNLINIVGKADFLKIAINR